MQDMQENVDYKDKVYSVYYEQDRDFFGGEICTCAQCGREYVQFPATVTITDVANAETMIPVSKKSPLCKAIKKIIERRIKQEDVICRDCWERNNSHLLW